MSQTPLKIYLAGAIPKGDAERNQWLNWRTDYTQQILQKIPQACFLDPDLIRDTVGSELVVGHDLWQIKRSDIMIVNIPEKVGAGTSQEMVLAKYFKKPVLTILPKDTHHRRTNVVFDGETVADWIHPFLDVSSDYIAESIDEVIVWIIEYLQSPDDKSIKDITIFDKVIDKFETELPDIFEAYKERGW